MTPFAYSLVNAAIENRMRKEQAKEVRELMNDIHCFDVTPIRDIIRQFTEQMGEETAEFIAAKLFLPAPRTWIECEFGDLSFAAHLRQAERGDPIGITIATRYAPTGEIEIHNWGFADPSTLKMTCWLDTTGYEESDFYTTRQIVEIVYAAICIINTPRTFGRRQHMPSRTLEKKLINKLGGAGKFPLHAWTTIRLEVTKPIDIDDGEPHEEHLTGRRALNFCRAYVRLTRGAIQYVRSHYRGDPALGIKRSRYEVTH